MILHRISIALLRRSVYQTCNFQIKTDHNCFCLHFICLITLFSPHPPDINSKEDIEKEDCVSY